MCKQSFGRRFESFCPRQKLNKKEGKQMSFRRFMLLLAISAGAELPHEVIREAIYG